MLNADRNWEHPWCVLISWKRRDIKNLHHFRHMHSKWAFVFCFFLLPASRHDLHRIFVEFDCWFPSLHAFLNDNNNLLVLSLFHIYTNSISKSAIPSVSELGQKNQIDYIVEWWWCCEKKTKNKWQIDNDELG